MRILIAVLFFLSSCIAAYEVSIKQKGKFRLQVDGDIQEQKYTLYNDAVGAAIDKMIDCKECVVYVVSPRFLVERKEVDPVDPPPVIIPPPIDPPPTESLEVYYSLTINNGELVGPKLLEGAVLPPQDVYIKWVGDGLDRVKSYCCKPLGGQHNEADIQHLGPTSSVLKLRRHAGEESRLELYTDAWVEGETMQSIYTFFEVDHTAVPPPVDTTTSITWTVPTERVDDTELKRDEIAGYIVKVSSIESNSKVILTNVAGTNFELDHAVLYPAEWAIAVAAFDTTPSRECPEDPEDIIPYSCGGPLTSEFSNFVEVEIE